MFQKHYRVDRTTCGQRRLIVSVASLHEPTHRHGIPQIGSLYHLESDDPKRERVRNEHGEEHPGLLYSPRYGSSLSQRFQPVEKRRFQVFQYRCFHGERLNDTNRREYLADERRHATLQLDCRSR